MQLRKTTEGVLRSQRNLTRYPLSARPAITAFVKRKAAEFQAECGKFRAPNKLKRQVCLEKAEVGFCGILH